MKYFLVIICFYFISCAPQIQHNTTFFKVHQINPRAQDKLMTVDIGDTLTVTGIVAKNKRGSHESPCLYFITGKQLVYVQIDSNSAQPGDNIQISGVVSAHPKRFSRVLRPIQSETLNRYNCYIQKTLAVIKKQNIVLPLPAPELEWIIVENKKHVIVFTELIDVMSVSHFDFVYSALSKRLDSIYIEKRFKGE